MGITDRGEQAISGDPAIEDVWGGRRGGIFLGVRTPRGYFLRPAPDMNLKNPTIGLLALLGTAAAVPDGVAPAGGEGAEPPPYTITETEIQLPGVTIDRRTREVRIDAEVCLTEGILEFVICKPGTFEHESIFTTQAKPELVHAALLLSGLKPTPQRRGLSEIWWEKALKQADSRVLIEVEWEEEGGKKRESLTTMLRNRELGEETAEGQKAAKKVVPEAWVFAGSFMQPTPKGERVYAGNLTGILVGIWPDPSTVIQFGLPSGNPYEGERLGLEVAGEQVPKLGTPVKLVFSKYEPEAGKDSSEPPESPDTTAEE